MLECEEGMKPKAKYTQIYMRKDVIRYFEDVGLKSKGESMCNFIYRLKIEHEREVGGFKKKIFLKH